MNKRILSFIFLLIQLSLMSGQNHNQYAVKHISSINGMSGNTIYSFYQDPAGYIWLGGTGGLDRYDGYRFVPFNNLGLTHKFIQHVGKFYPDERNNLLWMFTSTYTYGCYNLKKGCFVDFSNKKEMTRAFHKCHISPGSYWFWSREFGLRHISYRQGRFKTTDYTVANRRLFDNDIRQLAETSLHHIFLATRSGMILITSQGHVKWLSRGEEMLWCIANRNEVFAYSRKSQQVFAYNDNGNIISKCPLPAMMGRIGAIRSSFIWQEKWYILASTGTFIYDIKRKRFEKPTDFMITNGHLQDVVDSYQFVADKSGKLFIFPPKGKMRTLDIIPNLLSTIDKNGIYKVARSKNGLFYIATYGGGLFTYDYPKDKLTRYTAEDPVPLINSNFLLDVLIDHSGAIWISSERTGISLLSPLLSRMVTYAYPQPGKRGDWSNHIQSIFKNKTGQICIYTKDKKSYVFDVSSFRFSPITTLPGQITNSITDSKGTSWTTTRDMGLYHGSVNYSDLQTNHRISSHECTDIVEDKRGRIWVSTWNSGLYMVDNQNQSPLKFHRLINKDFNEARITNMELRNDGILFLGTYNGLYAVDTRKKHISDVDFKVFNVMNGKLPGDEVTCLRIDRKGMLWVGVTGCGLLKLDFSRGIDHMQMTQLTRIDGLSNNNVQSIEQDQRGYIWASSEEGVSRVNEQGEEIYRYELSSDILSNAFCTNSSMSMSDGRILFGSGNGLAVVSPCMIPENHAANRTVLITDLLINGTDIYEEGASILSDTNLSLTRRIELPHDKNSLTFFFSNCYYRNISSQVYQYYLEGSDRYWRHSTGNNFADYDNLRPGNYTFHVRSKSSNGWSPETVLQITIKSPWYATTWAWLLYVVIIAGIAFAGQHFWYEGLKLNRKLEVERQLTDFRINFFTNITHEFRTPLAIIQNSIERLEKAETVSKTAIVTARRGTNRLLRLVNQLMQFRKINTGNMRIAVEKGDIIAFTRNIFQDLYTVAQQKELVMTFTAFDRSHEIYFDRQGVEMMVYNILSNAVKYTPSKGHIDVKITCNERNVLICITDDGAGISSELRQSMFSPFMNGQTAQGGIGIGLYNAAQIAKLHHGSITYRQVNDVGGSCFTISLPDTETVYSAEEYKQSGSRELVEDGNTKPIDNFIREILPRALNDITVGIIEDDFDMMEQIRHEVGVYFNTKGFMNGETGYEGCLALKPALIICDVMLPDTDGYEIVKKFKKTETTKNIPIIMLTALADEAHQIKSYQAGADDYMIKPCNYRLLVARMVQFIKWRNEKPLEVTSSGTREIIVSKAERLFKEQVEALIVNHLDDCMLSVDALAEMMKMGRTKFYGKMKDLYGISPNKYIMNERMRIAAELVSSGKYTIAEVSYRVGIQDPSYFNKCFKAKYGVAPSKYK